MNAVVLDEIPLHLDRTEVFARIRMDGTDPEAGCVYRLIDVAEGLARPKALYRPGYIQARTEDIVTIDGVAFKSRVLRVNTDPVHQVFAYLATCGTELAAWAHSLEDMLEQWWADAIMELALRQAIRFLNEQLGRVVPIGKTSVMNPGSLADWPIQQQRPLFDLIGAAADAIGVGLTDSLLMTPAKTVSGIRFATEADFVNCTLCPRKECPNRRAPYEKDLYDASMPGKGNEGVTTRVLADRCPCDIGRRIMSKVRIGFVGTGGMGQMAHLRNYSTIDDCEIVAAAEIRQETARLVAARYGIPRIYKDHEEMLAAEQLDGIVASQPFSRHALLLPEIYGRVKHVFTEKPLAVSVEAAEKLAGMARDTGTVHMVGYHKRSDPAVIHAKDVIEQWKTSGRMGPMKYVRITMPAGDWIAEGFTGLLNAGDKAGALPVEPRPADVDEPTYKQYVSFVNYYIHQVNMMRHLLGEPYKVTYAEKSGVLLAIQSDSGIPGVIEMTAYRTTIDWEETLLVAFEKGYVQVRLPAPLACNRAGTVEVFADPGDGVTPQRCLPSLPWVHAMRQQAINFVKVCQGDMAPPCDAAEAVEDLEVARDYVRIYKTL